MEVNHLQYEPIYLLVPNQSWWSDSFIKTFYLGKTPTKNRFFFAAQSYLKHFCKITFFCIAQPNIRKILNKNLILNWVNFLWNFSYSYTKILLLQATLGAMFTYMERFFLNYPRITLRYSSVLRIITLVFTRN